MTGDPYIEHRHKLRVYENRKGEERWQAFCSCGFRCKPAFETEAQARRALSDHALDGQYSYPF